MYTHHTLNGFAQHLIKTGQLNQGQFDAIMEGNTMPLKSFILTLAQNKMLSDYSLARNTADYFKLPFVDLSHYDYNAYSTEILHSAIAQQHYALPLFERDHILQVAVIDPTLPELNDITVLTGKKTQFVIVEAGKLNKLIDKIACDNLTQLVENIDTEQDSQIPLKGLYDENSGPVVRFINKILGDAIKQRASDIHFEPYEGTYRIRFRIDGILTIAATPSKKLADYITARLKIMSNLDISERRVPQDGGFKWTGSTLRAIDIRINTCPTLYGEKLVLRLLELRTELLDIESLGLSDNQKNIFSKALKQPQGMILVTGPTGSGKTMTLYTALKTLNTVDKNISTVEDPVEIQLSGINQVHINLKTGLTFALALRAFLRQDPDIIMVGEIRDLETAEIAVKASQTGHLVLSTLHTNSAPETLVRLSNMGISSYNIASSISLIIAQRLVRRLCQQCKTPTTLPEHCLLEQGFSAPEITHLTCYGPSERPCQQCNQGYLGRLAIFEVMPISDTMACYIMEGRGALDLAKQAQCEKIHTLHQSALDKVRLGLTSLDEINRVIKAV